MERQIAIEVRDGRICCDVCGQPATTETKETPTREQTFYCDFDAERLIGWPESGRAIPIEKDADEAA